MKYNLFFVVLFFGKCNFFKENFYFFKKWNDYNRF